MTKTSKYRTISVFSGDADIITSITKTKPDTIIADTVRELMSSVDADSYFLVLRGEENISVVDKALNKYLLANKIDHKVSPVDESEFLAMLGALYLKQPVENINNTTVEKLPLANSEE